MTAIRAVICALMASGLAASAASIEQTFDIDVTGAFQNVTTNSPLNRNVELQRIQTFHINSANVVRALAIDSGIPKYTNFFNGTLIYKTSLDGSRTNVVIRQHAPQTNELDVTSNFVFTPGPFVVNQAVNPTAMKTNRVEIGLMSLQFTSSSTSFIPFGYSYGSSTHALTPLVRRIDGTNAIGYPTLLSYSTGSGLALLNTNVYTFSNNSFAGFTFVSNVPVQILFKTSNPVISPNDLTSP